MSARRIATRTRTTERWLIGERTNAETRAWAEGVLPEGAREARWVLDDGVEYDDSGPYVARQPEIRDADGCCVALTHTPGGGWDGDLIAASPDLARALIAKCDEVERLTRILAVERGDERLATFKGGLWGAVERYAVACGGSPAAFSDHDYLDRYRLTIDVESPAVSCWEERESVRGWLDEIRGLLAERDAGPPPHPDDTVAAVHYALCRLRTAERESERLRDWLVAIDGGDEVGKSSDDLRRMAYDALMGKEAPQ